MANDLHAVDESTAAAAVAGKAQQAVFRYPKIALLAVVLFAFTVTPFAGAAPGLIAIYLLPLSFGVWVVRTKTVADARGLRVRSVFAPVTCPGTT